MKNVYWIFFSLLIAPSWITAAEFYVAPNGLDSNPGSREEPFATIEQAQKAVRTHLAQSNEPATVCLCGGVYFLQAPLVFQPEDSGRESAPVVYTGYPGESPILSGGVQLHGPWKPYKDAILQTRIYRQFSDIDQLFVNGRRYHLARYPNYDPAAKFFGGTSADAVSPERVQTWSNPVGGYMHALHAAMWGSKHYRITGVNEDHTLQLQGGWQENRGGGFDPFFRDGYHNEYLFVENIFEELDAPGEWHLDRRTMTLSVIPRPGDDLSQAEVIGARLNELIILQGSLEDPIRHITFKNLQFKHTARIFMAPYERLLRGDWSIARLAALHFIGVEDVAVEDCLFEDLGGNGVFLDQYNRRIAVRGCEFHRLGESGVCVVGDVKAVRSPAIEYSRTLPQDQIDLTPGPQTANYPAQCVIENNLMHNFGQVGKQTAGVFLSMSEEISVRHNTIYDCPRAAICINDGCWGGHIIEYNDAFNTVRESGDHGPFNSWGRDRFWKTSYNGGRDIEPFAKERARLDNYKTTHIRNNRFAHDEGHSWGIDLDDGSSNYRVYNNLCLGMGVKLREGFFRRVENNIIVNGFGGFHIWLPGCDDIIARNIFISAEPYQFIRANPAYAKEFDYNLFYNYGDTPVITGVGEPMTLDEWKAKGFDVHSIVADPLFIHPGSGDYRVQPDSPALQLGFKNFPMDQFGVSKPEFQRKAALAPRTYDFYPKPSTKRSPDNTSQQRTQRFQWLGATFKNLIGEAETSAAGLGKEAGVLCMDAPEESEASAIGFKPGDVIIRVNHRSVNTVKDFLKILAENEGKSLTIAVFNAVERTIHYPAKKQP
ncbi:MAG: right-handed parallel beta-helix repeat-containing protein [Candidatus Hinthialibacter sp.]